MNANLLAWAVLATAQGSGNHPPEFTAMDEGVTCHVGSTCDLHFSVRDEDQVPITVTTTPLPDGAVLTPTSDFDARAPAGRGPTTRSYVITLKPTPEQTGTSRITVTAGDGSSSSSRELTWEIEEEWEVFAMPGAQYLAYQPRQLLSSGGYQGFSVEFLGAAWAHRNNKQGPSHGRVYLDLDLLFPTSGHGGNLYAYTLGADLTLERNPNRRFLLPYFGAELGGVHSALLHDFFIAIPYGGVHVWADRNLWVNVSGGYLFPGRNLDELSGAWAKAGLNMSFW